MTSEVDFRGYSAPIWRLFNETPRAGDFPTGTPNVTAVQVRTPAGRAVMRLALCCESGRVVDARFRAYGCPTSIAVAAWIAEWSVGRNISELSVLKAEDILQALEISDDRTHCALQGEDLIKAAVGRLEGVVKL